MPESPVPGVTVSTTTSGPSAVGDGQYRPSPRPTYDGPALITPGTSAHHIWGDQEAGLVADSIYVSSDLVHALVFELPPHGSFRHSREYRTVFGADELLYVLEGTMAIANPESGEVQRIGEGEAVFFRRDTWHHAFAHGAGPLRVLELFAPPPAKGTSGAYARQRPYLEESKYADDRLLGNLVGPGPEARSFAPVCDRALTWRRDLGVLVGLYVSTENLTAGVIEVDAGQASEVHEHGGDEIVYVVGGRLLVRAWDSDKANLFEIGPDEACYLPKGTPHEYRNFGSQTVRAIFAVAPSYLAGPSENGS
jgi:mannose-6-phosphate isomerase-like protein (cupin superfamily)